MSNATRTSAINNFRYYSLCSSCPSSTTAPWQWPPTQHTSQLSTTAHDATPLPTAQSWVVKAVSTPFDGPLVTTTPMTVPRTVMSTLSSRLILPQTTSLVVHETRVSTPPAQDSATSVSRLTDCVGLSAPLSCSVSTTVASGLPLVLTRTSLAMVKISSMPSTSTTLATIGSPIIKGLIPQMTQSQTTAQMTSTPVSAASQTSKSYTVLAISSSAGSAVSSTTPLFSSTLATAVPASSSHSEISPSPSLSSDAVNAAPRPQAGFVVALTLGIIFTVLLLILIARFLRRCLTLPRPQSQPSRSGDLAEINVGPGKTKAIHMSLFGAQQRCSATMSASPMSSTTMKSWPLDMVTTQVLNTRSANAQQVKVKEDHDAYETKELGGYRPQVGRLEIPPSNFLLPPTIPSPWSWLSFRTGTTTSRVSYDSHGQRRRSDPFDLEEKGL